MTDRPSAISKTGAKMGVGGQISWLRKIVLVLLAQGTDNDPQVLHVGSGLPTPNRSEQGGIGDWDAGLLHPNVLRALPLPDYTVWLFTRKVDERLPALCATLCLR
jgi:hypothetical protein